MYITQVEERLVYLKREVQDLKQMNLRYWGQAKHTAFTTAAHEARRLRLTGIKNELAHMMRRAA